MNLRLYFIQQIGLFTQWGTLVEGCQCNKNKLRGNTELFLYIHIHSRIDQLFPYLYQEHQAQQWNSIVGHWFNNKPQKSSNTLGIYFFFFFLLKT